MAHSAEALRVEECRRKAYDYSIQSTDCVFPVMSRALEAMVLVHSEKYDSKHIQRALRSFDVERKVSMEYEESNTNPLRKMTDGFIECIHLSILHLTEKIVSQKVQIDRHSPKSKVEQYIQTDETLMAMDACQMKVKIEELMDENPERVIPVAIEDVQEIVVSPVEKWKRKIYDASSRSTDCVLPVMSRALESMLLLTAKNYDSQHIQRALRSFESERKLSMEYDDTNEDIFREILHGFLESVYLTFRLLTDKIDKQIEEIDKYVPKSIIDRSIQTDEIPLGFDIDEMKLNMEEITFENTDDPSLNDDVIEVAEYPHAAANSLDGLSKVPNFAFRLEIKVEPRETIDTAIPIGSDDQIPVLYNMGGGMDLMNEETEDVISDALIEKEGENEESIDHATDPSNESSETVEVEKRRRSSRIISKSMNYTESMEASDADFEPAEKKSKADSAKKKKNEAIGSSKLRHDQSADHDENLNSSELECPECEYRTHNVNAWMSHLRSVHSTTPKLAGLALLCACGNESLSPYHIKKCTIANVTVIRKRDGPIRRLGDGKCDKRQFTLHRVNKK